MLAKCGNGMVQKLKKRFLSDGEVSEGKSRSPFSRCFRQPHKTMGNWNVDKTSVTRPL
jgi:hypothetical protein